MDGGLTNTLVGGGWSNRAGSIRAWLIGSPTTGEAQGVVMLGDGLQGQNSGDRAQDWDWDLEEGRGQAVGSTCALGCEGCSRGLVDLDLVDLESLTRHFSRSTWNLAFHLSAATLRLLLYSAILCLVHLKALALRVARVAL